MSQEEQAANDFAKLNSTRGANRGVVTKYDNEIKDIVASCTDPQKAREKFVRLNSIATTLKEKRQFLKALDDAILAKTDLGDVDKEIDESSDWETRIYECLERIEAFKRGDFTAFQTLSQAEQQSPGPSTVQATAVGLGANGVSLGAGDGVLNSSQIFDGNLSLGGGNSTRSSTNSANIGVRLPKINLPAFNGEQTQFQTFWQSFDCAVHSNEGISKIHKLNYLLNVLEGKAHRAVAGLELKEENYDNAIKILKERFGNKQQIISSHMQALLKLQGLPNEKVSQLRIIFDQINAHVRGLETLGVTAEKYGSLLIPIIMSRMPSDITVQVARKIKEDIWPIDEILDIIKDEISAREYSEKITVTEKRQQQHAQTKSTPGATRTFLTKGERVDSSNERCPSCYFCHGEHLSIDCTEVKDPQKRQEILKKTGRCYKCMRTGHPAKNCNKRCRKCSGSHHQAICFKGKEPPTAPPAKAETKSESTLTAKSTADVKVMLQTAKAFAFGEDKSKGVMVNVLLDGGSQRSYVTEELVKKLSLDVDRIENLNINTFGTEKFRKQKCSVVTVNIELVDSSELAISALSYPVICSNISSDVDISEFPHLRGLRLADSPSKQGERIDLLIGMNYYHHIVTGEVVKGKSGPVAVNSKLGWLLSGPYNSSSNGSSNVMSNLVLDSYPQRLIVNDIELQEGSTQKDLELQTAVKDFWKHEAMGIEEIVESVASEAVQKSNEFDIKLKEKRYEVSLPWRSDFSSECLSDNYQMCLKRLGSLRNRLKQDHDLLNEYDSILKEQLLNGIIECVPEDQLISENTHYLCHHAVVRKDHDTTKVRIVFDGSAKSQPDKLSLNEALELGENFMPSLFDTLLLFRVYPIALTADIEKAFLQIGIKPADRDSLRFLWYDDVQKENPLVIQLRWTRLAFGLKPSPSILGATIKQHVSLFEEESPEVVKILSRLYADDMSCSVKSSAEALEIYQTSKDILLKGGFNLRKWKTNDKELLNHINSLEGLSRNADTGVSNFSEDDQSFTQFSVGPPNSGSAANTTKILGVPWNYDSDELFLDLKPLFVFAKSLIPTKRSLLQIAAKVFDPLGCISLFTINLKALFQDLCVAKVAWDEPLEGDYLKRYKDLISRIGDLKEIQLKRSLFAKGVKVSKVELHAFSDASERSYATVIYLRIVYESGDIKIHFVTSKAKVSPIKKQSIPRLELLGATLMSKLVHTVLSVLQKEVQESIDTYYWIDSMATLCWIKNDKPWKQFVRHRVSEILKLSSRDNWYHCPGPQNPADLPSRGNFAPLLAANPFWWEGPEFLKLTPDKWPSAQMQSAFECSEALAEKVKAEPKVTHVMVNSEKGDNELSNVIDISRSSSKGKLLRTIAWVFRFVHNLRAAANNKRLNKENILSASEIENAELHIIRSIQSQAFKAELNYLSSLGSKTNKRPPLYVSQFNLFLDKEQVLRCRTRLNKASISESSKQPILLPTGNHYALLLIQECHRKVFHNGVRETLNLLRQGYWIPRGREMVKRTIRNCILCKRLEAVPFRSKFCVDLPEGRIDDSPPFTNTGMDFAGPLLLSDKNIARKHYVCLFTCMSTRAIHLELVPSLEVDEFLRAFRRFCARRGLPSTLYSDNATTFKSASKEITKLVRSPRLQENLSSQGIKWIFITERSPWQGGAWERLIRSVKRCIIKVVGRANLGLHEMNTILTEVEGVINSRPITYVFDDKEGISYPLTPSHLVNGRNLLHLPNYRYHEVVSTYETLSKRARYSRFLLGHFTKRWKNEYLLGLMECYKPKDETKEPVVAVGDMVIIKDDQEKRMFWKLARIQELIPGKDGRVRSARIVVCTDKGKIGNKVLCRPLKLLIPLEVPADFNQLHHAPPQALPLAQPQAQTQVQTQPPNQIDRMTRSKRSAGVIGEFIRRQGRS